MALPGASFQPMGESASGTARPGQPPNSLGTPGQPPVQQAIKFLSLRLPRFTSQGALAPGALLQSPGGQGMDLAALMRLIGGMRPGAPSQAAPALPSPTGSPNLAGRSGGSLYTPPPPKFTPGGEVDGPPGPSAPDGLNYLGGSRSFDELTGTSPGATAPFAAPAPRIIPGVVPGTQVPDIAGRANAYQGPQHPPFQIPAPAGMPPPAFSPAAPLAPDPVLAQTDPIAALERLLRSAGGYRL